MSNISDLKQIERKAYRFIYEDGLLDILMGAMIGAMAVTLYHPDSGYSAINIVMMWLIYAVLYLLFLAGKYYITRPRMGKVRFGLPRKQRNKTLAIILGIIVLIQALFVGLTIMGWSNPALGEKLFGFLGYYNSGRLAVAAVSSLFVGPSMLVIAFMIDFPRGYYIAILMALAVFLMIYINQPIYPVVIGGLIIVPGLVLFTRFLKKYPIPHGDETNG
jgi:hypothetical protein